jgi:hypothetical protein
MSGGANLLPSAGIIGCVDYATGGTVSTISPAFGGGGGNLGFTQWAGNATEGCQCMIGGIGPGPYGLIDTVIDNRATNGITITAAAIGPRVMISITSAISFSGNRSIERVRRVRWLSVHFAPAPRVETRFPHLLGGTIFRMPGTTGKGSALMMLAGNKDGGAHDILYTNNEFRHGPGVTQGFNQYEEGAAPGAGCGDK